MGHTRATLAALLAMFGAMVVSALPGTRPGGNPPLFHEHSLYFASLVVKRIIF